jgi:sulfatase modifying factor 1
MHPIIKTTFVTFALVAITSFKLQAGTLEPTSPPAPSMYTLEEIYQKVSFLGPAQTLSATSAALSAGYYNSIMLYEIDADLVASNIRSGVVIFGIVGTYNGDSNTNEPPPASTGMSLIPAGAFVMGDTLGDIGWRPETELPLHTNYISAFYMDKYEVTKALWYDVEIWASINGYSFGSIGSGRSANHPVHSIDWFDAIAWCNARSEREGLTPCYTNANGSVYRDSSSNSFDGGCNWSADGYRLPTEAEWEKAARGGLDGKRFSWGDTISHGNANYYAQPMAFSYDVNPREGYHPTFNDSDPYTSPLYTSPVGYFAPNGYGLYDMLGNVSEWCWDWFGESYYSSSPSTDPHGPPSGEDFPLRVRRGGSWGVGVTPIIPRVALREYAIPDSADSHIGFRCARGL